MRRHVDLFLAVKQDLAIGRDPAGVGFQEAGDELQSQGLAGPGVAEEDGQFIFYPPVNLQLKTIDLLY